MYLGHEQHLSGDERRGQTQIVKGDYATGDWSTGSHVASALSAGQRHIPTILHLITIYADLTPT